MAIKVDVEIDNAAVGSIEAAVMAALDLTLEDILTDVQGAAVVPFDQGTLQGSGFATDAQITADGAQGEVVFDTPYARRLYFSEGYNFQTVHNRDARDHWLEDYTDGGQNEDWIKQTFETHLKEQLE